MYLRARGGGAIDPYGERGQDDATRARQHSRERTWKLVPILGLVLGIVLAQLRRMADEEREEWEFVSTIGSIRVDWPRALGYYGAIAAAVAFDVIAPPLGVFIAVVPLLKFLKRKGAPAAERFVAAVIEGAGKPVGGDAEGVVRPKWVDDEKAAPEKATPPTATDPRPAPASADEGLS